MIDNIIGMLVFGAFVAVAIWQRLNSKVHKRLIFIANGMRLPPALSRIAWVAAHASLVGLSPLGMIVGLFVFDLFSWRRPLAVTISAAWFLWPPTRSWTRSCMLVRAAADRVGPASPVSELARAVRRRCVD